MENQLLKELIDSGSKFNQDRIIFITKDKSGQLIWLEEGNSSAGWIHIKQRHAKDFLRYNIREEDIPEYLYKVITNGEILLKKKSLKGNSMGYNAIYLYENKECIISGIGTNGFIVSAFPSNPPKGAKDE